MKMMKKQLRNFAILLGLFSFSAQAINDVAWSVGQTAQTMSKFVQNKLNNDELRNLARQFFAHDDARSVFNIMRILALKDDRSAQLDVGRFYFGGDGVERNYEKAYWWFSEAAEKGSVNALTNYVCRRLWHTKKPQTWHGVIRTSGRIQRFSCYARFRHAIF